MHHTKMSARWIFQYRTELSHRAPVPGWGVPSIVRFTRFVDGLVDTRVNVKVTNGLRTCPQTCERVLSVQLIRDSVVRAYHTVGPETVVPVVSLFGSIEDFVDAEVDIARDLAEYIESAVAETSANSRLSVAHLASHSLFGDTNNDHASRFCVQRQVLDELFEEVDVRVVTPRCH
jgi:hypothetical protein